MMLKQVVIFLLLLGNLLVADAQVANVVVDPQIPFAGQNFDLLVESYVCYPPNESVVVVENNIIKVLTLVYYRCGTIDPPPPPSVTGVYDVAEISGLNEGSYTFEYYEIRDPADFPPIPADYPSYFIDEIQFEVRGNPSPSSVDATSALSLIFLILLILSISLLCFRKI